MVARPMPRDITLRNRLTGAVSVDAGDFARRGSRHSARGGRSSLCHVLMPEEFLHGTDVMIVEQ